jgi:hypothetical protein
VKRAWTVIWRGKQCTAFLTIGGGWSVDAIDARVFDSWHRACDAAGVTRGASIVRCWEGGLDED